MFNLTQRDPMLDLLHQLNHRMGRLYNTEPQRTFEWPVPEATTTAWLPLVDIFEESDVIRLVAEVPGVRPEDGEVSGVGTVVAIRDTSERVGARQHKRR